MFAYALRPDLIYIPSYTNIIAASRLNACASTCLRVTTTYTRRPQHQESMKAHATQAKVPSLTVDTVLQSNILRSTVLIIQFVRSGRLRLRALMLVALRCRSGSRRWLGGHACCGPAEMHLRRRQRQRRQPTLGPTSRPLHPR